MWSSKINSRRPVPSACEGRYIGGGGGGGAPPPPPSIENEMFFSKN
jgi:hypothetical protein